MGTEETIATVQPLRKYMRLRLSMLYARSLFGLLVFTPKRNIYGTSDIRVWYKILLRAIGFHPEENYIKGALVIRTLCKILLRAIGFSPRSKLSYRWNGYARFSRRFTWPLVLLNCSQPMGFLSDNSETHPKVGPWLWGQPFALYLLQ